jgi:putative ABC transport system permease protein
MWWLLRRLVDRTLANDIAGDLLEARRKRAERSKVRAALWYWHQGLAIVVHVLAVKTRQALLGAAAAPRGFVRRHSLRYAFRSLRRAPWYSATIVGVMALSVALASTVFAVVDGVLFKPLPYPNAKQLVSVEAGFRSLDPKSGAPGISLPDVEAWRASLPGVAFTAFRVGSPSRLEEVNDLPFGVAEVQPNFFDAIGVRPLLGGFQPEHFSDRSGVGVTILSYQLWQARFAGAADIVGTRVVRGTATMLIVGVMPRDFVFPARTNAQILMPLVPSERERTSLRARSFQVVARLPVDLSTDAATRRVESAMADVARVFPPLPPPPPGMRYGNPQFLGPLDRATLHPLDERLSATARPLFLAVSLASAALVLLGCVNVSGLMAARSLDRAQEIGLRRALGAGAGDLSGLITAEAALLVAAGTATGLALSAPVLAMVLRLLPTDLTLLKTPAIDWRVGVFAVLVMTVSVAAISAWPIRRVLRSSGLAVASSGSRSVTRSRSLGRAVVIASQVAIGLVLTLGGALLVGSLARLWQDDVGLTSRSVAAVELRIPAAVLDSPPEILDTLVGRLMLSVRSLPGVVQVGATDAALFRNLSWADIGFKPPAGAKGKPWVDLHGVTDGFFDAVQLRLLAGRLPTNEELDAGRQVVVVSESIAKAYWPAGSAVGKELELSGEARRRFEVIGVVADARFRAWDDAKSHPLYGPLKALRRGIAPTLLIRTSGSADGRVLGETLRLIGEQGPQVRASRAMSLDAMMADSVRPRRFQSWLFGSFAVAALAIVGVGILGLMAMTMARRTREIGIRVALGATRRSVVSLVVGEQSAAVAAGLAIGGGLSFWLVRFVRAYLYEMTPYDPIAWTSAVMLILSMALVGALIPAVRAGRVDPVRALRAD